jgi:hypothetical protein
MRDPVLASGSYFDRVPMVYRVHGGLHYVRCNAAPYFTLTVERHRKGFPNQCQSGGCDHEFILKHHARFTDLAALHLSYIDGAPLHAVANGWYWLAGALGGLGERYHGGNSKGQHGGEYREPTPTECLQVFAQHCRIDITEAERIRDHAAHLAALRDTAKQHPRAYWQECCDAMRPRWKAEADACIAKHGLVVFGDPWQQVAA